MNGLIFRLVFDAVRGMYIPVAESQRARPRRRRSSEDGRSAHRVVLALAVAGGVGMSLPEPAVAQRAPRVFAPTATRPAAPLPQPYGAATGRTDRSFVANPALAPRVSWTVNGNQATFNQGAVDRVILNWDSFDIGTGYRVHFSQNTDPTRYVSALNRIWSNDPSVILGSLTADREVILVNANGIYFGRGARVDTGKFIATSLGLSDAVFEKGIRNVVDGSAVFTADGTDYVATSRGSLVAVEAGAELRTAANGDVLLIAPRVVNEGRIETPQGQAILAAGSRVYLMSSSDPAQRGLIVAVDPYKLADSDAIDPSLGIVENAATGSYKTVNGATVDDQTPDGTAGLVNRLNEIRAESGTVNLVGLTVRQNGQINATTAVKGANGAIYLQAMASTVSLGGGLQGSAADRRGLTLEAGSFARVGAELGTVEIGAGSVTAVHPDAGVATQLDAETFNASRIRVEGAAISVAAGARIEAPSGSIELLAAQSSHPESAVFDRDAIAIPLEPDASRIVIAPGALLSAAGLRDVAIDGARNQGDLRLFRIELADAPVQRSGPLYRSRVYFDLRDADSIDMANVEDAASAIGRTAAERSTVGGTIRIESEGTVVIGEGATLDVSGGSVAYSPTQIQNSLVQQRGRVRTFGAASGATRVDGLPEGSSNTPIAGYTEGRDGGTLTISSRTAAIAGTLRGEVVEGQYQRDGSTKRAAPATLQVGRLVGNDYYLPSLRLQPGTTPAIDAAIFADPLGAALDGLAQGADLSLATVQQGGFGALTLRAAGITQPAFGSVDLGILGTLDVRGDGVSLDGAYRAPGGTLRITSGSARGDGDILLSAVTRLDAAGLWANDTAAGGSIASVQVDGGDIDVAAGRSLLIAPGAAIDVSGGARLTSGKILEQGEAGSILLRSGQTQSADSDLQIAGVRLRGLDFGAGGTLAIVAPQLTVTEGSASGFTLAPSFFSSSGFGNISVDTWGDIVLASGTRLAPQLLNWELVAGYHRVASGDMSSAVAVARPVDERLADRQPVSVALSATGALNPQANQSGGSIVVERGSSIVLEPGAALALSATRNIEVGASGGQAGQASVLSVPGGSIELHIGGERGGQSAAEDPVGFLPDQAIWLGQDARLSVAGTAELRPDQGGTLFQFGMPSLARGERLTGTVYGGGTIELQAERGYVVAEKGSSMALDGAVADISLHGRSAPVTVAKAAGTLVVSTPEGFLLEGTISAQAPHAAQGQALADRGRIDLSVGRGGVSTETDGNPYPDAGNSDHPRELRIGASADVLPLSGARPGDDLNAVLGNGIGYVPVELLRGFDDLRLAAGDVVHFVAPADLSKPLGIVLEAPALKAGPGVQVTLAASSIAIGDDTPSSMRLRTADVAAEANASPDASTSLTLRAPLIQVAGQSGLKGFSRVTLDAGAQPGGEIRLTGGGSRSSTLLAESTVGQLNFAGELDLIAGQVYATSGMNFTIAGLAAVDEADAGSRVTVRTSQDAAVPAAPLSAFGSLTVSATDIDQGGVLRQPFGAITLEAERTLRLAPGSLTSVAGDGSVLLYGETYNLSQWLVPGNVAVATDKTVTLTAAHIDAAASAVIDGTAGGDVGAWEFFPGVGGSADHFDDAGLYAVLPDYADSRTLALSGLLPYGEAAQQIVITMEGSGLPPGRYNLLPARYALVGGSLPRGAFLVRRAAEQGSAVLNAALAQDDGSVVVTGYLTQAGSINTGVPGERFVVETEAGFRERSEIRVTSVSELLAGNATGSGGGLPRDGAHVSATATGSDASTWLATVALGASGSGAAGLLDFSAEHIALVRDAAQAPEGALTIAAQTLIDSGAGSVLLGAQRAAQEPTEDGAAVWAIGAPLARTVTVDAPGQKLTLDELILAAGERVELADGTELAAVAHGAPTQRRLTTSGDGAIAVLSVNDVELQRSGAVLAGGDLHVGTGVVLTGASLALDATGVLAVDRSAQLHNDTLSLGARHIVVGADAADDPRATALTGELLAAAQAAHSLALRSYSSIDFAGQQQWEGSERLVLDAPVVRGLEAPDGSAANVRVAAGSIVVRNTTGRSADVATGQGSLTLRAEPLLQYGVTGGLTIGSGDVSLAFDAAELRSTGDIVLQGSGAVRAQGDLLLSAARVTAATGARRSVQADAGTLTIAAETGSRTLGERVGQGASVALSARTVQQNGTVDLAGGQLSVTASGDAEAATAISFGAGSSTSVAGFALPGPDGFEAFGSAGSITASAARGRIEILGTLDVSAARRANGSAGAGDAGTIAISATGADGALVLSADGVTGRLAGHRGSEDADLGGSLAVDVATLSDVTTLARAATDGGLTRAIDLRVRGGDVALDSNLTAQHIAVSVDGGRLDVGGVVLDARSATGGVVQLGARDALTVAGGARIDARSQRAGANGGDVLLASSTGRVSLDSTAVIDARGDDDADGRIVLRALRDGSSVKVDALNAANLQAGEVDIEAVRVYSTVTVGANTRAITDITTGNSSISGTSGRLGQNSVQADSNAYMAQADAILGQLGVADGDRDRVRLRAGVEVQAAGNLTVAADWALQNARPGGEAGFLTLRAAGNLVVNGSLSDGFTTTTAAGVLNNNDQSWSMRLAAGADLGAANPLAVRDLSGSATDTGNVIVNAGRMVRTGAGSIDLAAGRDIRFMPGSSSTNPGGMAYVAGRHMEGESELLADLFAGQTTGRPTFTEQGGRLTLAAQRDITAPEATQLVNNWLWRTGLESTVAAEAGLYSRQSQLAWWTQFASFRQTLGSFGGGDLTVTAGRDIVNVQAAAPTTGWADSREMATAELQVRNGADVTVTAGHDVRGGQYFAAAGAGRISAGGSVGEATGNLRVAQPILALMNGASWRVNATSDVAIAGAFNPTAMLVPNTVANGGARSPMSGYYYTWGDGAGLDLASTSGSVAVSGIRATEITGLGLMGSADYLRVLPANLRVVAARDIDFSPESPGVVLFPATRSELRLWAGDDVVFGEGTVAQVDSDTTLWPDFSRPVGSSGGVAGQNGLIMGTLNDTSAHAGLRADDSEPVYIHAEGSVRMGPQASLVVAKQARITAGEDIIDLQLIAQNLSEDDVTSIVAGRDVRLSRLLSGIDVAGPGALEVIAGRDIDLGTSRGITTIGNERNASLSTQGASIKLQAAASGELDVAAFESAYLAPSTSERWQDNRDLLLAYVRAQLKQPDLTYEQAWAYFRSFPAVAQAELGRQVLAAEFGAMYLAGTAPTSEQMTAALRDAFEAHKAHVLQAGANALAAGESLELPGREELRGSELSSWLAALAALQFSDLDLGTVVSNRVADLTRVRNGWRTIVAQSLGGTVEGFAALVASSPDDPAAKGYVAALSDFSGRRFEAYRDQVLASEIASAGAAASLFGRASLPMRLALFDQGFRVAELAGVGSFVEQPVWAGAAPAFKYDGTMELTQSSVMTERGGAIGLINAGGPINVGLREDTTGASTGIGVIALGGGDIFGFAKNDFQVNNQRVFTVDRGNMNIWSSIGDIDSGRGANTAVAAPPLAARRSMDGVVFEVQATTTGSGLGILPGASGAPPMGTIGLYPAFGEILALDAYIRAPAVIVGSTVRGSDNLISAAISGATAPVAAPPVVTPSTPPPSTQAAVDAAMSPQNTGNRPGSSLLTVELLGLGTEGVPEDCKDDDEREACKKARR